MKFLYFLLFIKISLSNPISENNKVTLESVLSVIYKSIENQEFDNFWIRKIHTIEDVKKTCVLQKLQLENFDENPNLIIKNPKDFSEENLKNRKIIFAIKKAAQLCFTEQVFKSNPWAQIINTVIS
ncbi:hypothetical protein PVAND_014610 [Polypedilum vanderplanki]|uniref:Uncharacterized protein n=1 Tax=Polypedilum vanderplanki TaxID=319348 RepID=A0A9J6BAI1_POLVA|nr:hypothetical protein PVAND_014610 [Polypedilum vanderplanki]